MATEKFLDLDRVLKTRNPKTYKFTPRFLIRLLEKVIKQDEMNDFVHRNKDAHGQDFLKALVKDFNIKIKFSGLENIPANKRYVFASNHPLGGLDGISLLHLIYSYLGDDKAIVNDLLLNIENLRPVFAGVNVFGKFSKKQIQDIDDLYASNKQIVVFPAGLVSRKIKKQITDLKWKKSFLTKAIEYKRDIIPVYADAKNTKFFYNFANFRKFIGLKFNIELVLLPSEMYKFVGKTITFHFGEAIDYQLITKEKSLNEWVEIIRKKTYDLKNTTNKITDFNPDTTL